MKLPPSDSAEGEFWLSGIVLGRGWVARALRVLETLRRAGGGGRCPSEGPRVDVLELSSMYPVTMF